MEPKVLELTDLQCSAYLSTLPSCKYIGTKKDARGRILFCFANCQKASEYMNLFFSGQAEGNISNYAQRLKDFKSLLHSLNGNR